MRSAHQDEGVPRSRTKIILRLLFGDTQAKTKALVEELCLAGLEEDLIPLASFEGFLRSVLLVREAWEVASDLFDHITLLKGVKAKVGCAEQNFVEVFFKNLETMNRQHQFLFEEVDRNNLPQLDIANEDLKKFNLEKMYRTVLRVLFN